MEDFGFGDILQSVRQSIGLTRDGERAASPAFPVFGFPQPVQRSPSVTAGHAGSAPQHRLTQRSASMVGARPPHRYLGMVRGGPNAAPTDAIAAAKARHAVDELLGPDVAAGQHWLGRSKLMRSFSTSELQDMGEVIKSGRLEGGEQGSRNATPEAAAVAPGGEAQAPIQPPATADPSDRPRVGGSREEASHAAQLHHQISTASSLTSLGHDTPREGGLQQHPQPQLEATPPSSSSHTGRTASLPREVQVGGPASAQRPWSAQAQRGAPITPRLTRLNTASAGDDEISTGGSSRVPKDGLVSPGTFLDESFSPRTDQDAKDLAELLRQQLSRHDKAE